MVELQLFDVKEIVAMLEPSGNQMVPQWVCSNNRLETLIRNWLVYTA